MVHILMIATSPTLNGSLTTPITEQNNEKKNSSAPQINTWQSALAEEKKQAYFKRLLQDVAASRSRHTVYPPTDQTFSAFKLTPLESIKVVIIGQDPYHGAGQAHGLCFSVPYNTSPPPSLKNIFKCLDHDLHIKQPGHGNLSSWAAEGVFLLNHTLTVISGQPNSHQNLGWSTFTDRVITIICSQPRPIVFMLWGSFAQKQSALIHQKQHLVLKAPHPSPLSAHRGFLTCKHFSKANDWLMSHGQSPVNWSSHL